MKNFPIIALIIFLCACSSSQPIPQWKDASFRQLESYKVNFLMDKEDMTEPHFAKAKKAVSSGNNLDLLATVYLTKYALHTAALEDFDDSEFLRIDKIQPNRANRSYYDFLKGNFSAVDTSLLLASYSKLLPWTVNKNSSAAFHEVISIGDPLSALIACGVWTKYLPYDENFLQFAVDTSAANGWRRPLWAYLTKMQNFYLERRETTKAKDIQERLDLLQKQQ